MLYSEHTYIIFTIEIKLNGQKTYYTDTKHGKPVLFLHGWMQSSDCWDIPSALKQKHRIVTIDLPGHGKTEITKAYTLDELVGLILQFSTELKIEKPVLICHSMASEIAARLLSFHPDFAQAVVLIAPAGIRTISFVKSRKMALLSLLPLSSKAKAAILKQIYKRSRTEKLHQNANKDELLRQTFINIVSENVIQNYKTFKVPTYVIWGEKDTIIPLKVGRTLVKMIKNSQLYIMENSGHFPFVEHRKEFYKFLGQLLTKIY